MGRVFEEFRRILKPGGLFMFSTLGPDTLKELRECWKKIDHFTHVNAFIDMHDIGDALLRNLFSEPVMDVERFTLTYKEVKTLMHDLKMLGAHNVTAGRRHTLTGKGRFRALAGLYEKYRHDGVLPASYEVIYGHAWVPEKKQKSSSPAHEARIPLSQLRHRQGEIDDFRLFYYRHRYRCGQDLGCHGHAHGVKAKRLQHPGNEACSLRLLIHRWGIP